MIGSHFSSPTSRLLVASIGMIVMVTKAMFRSQPINPVNAKKMSHRMFGHMHGVLNKIYLRNFLHGWVVNREMNLMSLLNP